MFRYWMTLMTLSLSLTACGSGSRHAPLNSPPNAALPSPHAQQAALDDMPIVAVDDVAADADVAVEVQPSEDKAPTDDATYVRGEVEPLVAYTLRRGETLDHFARWSELPVEIIAEASAVSLTATLDVGTIVQVPADHARRSRIEQARDAHHLRRAEGYLESRGGASATRFYVVKTGDTAWSIARRQGDVPVWLVEAFNPSMNLDALRPGEVLMLPILADMEQPMDAHEAETLSLR